jgi:hypothetical protein
MKKILIILFPTLLLLTGCVDTLDDYNVDQKRATRVPAETLFSNALKNLADIITTPNVNNNNFRLYVQHWTTTTYLDEPRYNLTARAIPQNFWQTLYRDVLMDLREAKTIINSDQITSADVKTNQLAQAEIIEVYTWFVLVNTFGNIPYTQALNPDVSLPVYDEAETIYQDIVSRLNAAIASLNPELGGFEDGDLIYKGDMTKWVKFGNSLKLKVGMVLADVEPAQAKSLVEQAAPHVFESNADNARFPYVASPPNNNPIATNLNPLFTKRQDFVAANTLVNQMNLLNDPRRQFYFTTIEGNYVGGRYGFTNLFAQHSKPSEKVIDPTFEALLLDYSEVEFLLAEAVERGMNVEGSAESHYNNAVTASILYWGGTEQQATAYLAQPGVKYTTIPGNYRQKIGTQKWIALYNRGWDAWLEWRRLDYPTLAPPSGDGAPPGLKIPLRLIYPINEQTLNGANRTAAAESMGGDLATVPLFWDINSPQ